MPENRSKWIFDLDVKEATEGILNLQGKISKLGSGEDVKGLIEGLTKVTVVIGLVGAAVYAVKVAMDQTFEGENINAVNQQFEILTRNAGLAGHALKEGLVEASGGLIDDTDLLKTANESIVKMGANAKKLPEIMTLARQAAAVSGKDLKTTFDDLSTALANGNARALKQVGIIVDAKKAEQDYARSIGQTVDVLSQQGKQTALINAALEKSKTAFAGVNVDVKSTQDSFQRLGVAFADIKDSIAVMFEKVMGPWFKAIFDSITSVLGAIGTKLQGLKNTVVDFHSKWGENAEVTDRQLNKLNGTLEEQRLKLAELKKDGVSFWSAMTGETTDEAIKKQEQLVLMTEAEINGLKSKKKELEDVAEAQKKTGADSQEGGVDKGAAALKQAEFEKSLQAMRAKTLEMAEGSAEDVATVEQLHWQRKMQLFQEQEAYEKSLDAQRKEGKITEANEDLLIEQQRQQTNIKLAQMDDSLEKKRIDALERYAEHNKNTAKGFSGAWQAETAKATASSHNFAKLGQTAFVSLKTHAVDAFKAIGNGSKDAATAMKDAMLSTLGDIAIAQGTEMLMEGLGRAFLGDAGGGAAAAEGGALIAFGSALQSAGGGGGSVSSSGGGGGGGGGGSYGGSDTIGSSAQENPSVATPKKSVTIQVQGNYFETEQTKTALIDMIKAANDATDYSFKQIGQ